MQIQVGGARTAERQLSTKVATFMGAGTTGGLDSGDGGLSGDVDAATLATFAHVHALQGTGASGVLSPIAREVGEMGSGGVARGPSQSLGLTSLQGLSAADLNLLMQAQQESLDRQRRRLTQTMGAEGQGGYAWGGNVRMVNQASNEEMGTMIGEGGGGRLGKFVGCKGAEVITEGSANLDLLLHRGGGLSGPMRVGLKNEREIVVLAESQSALLGEYRRAYRPTFDERTSYV